jgi:hypothetical protein
VNGVSILFIIATGMLMFSLPRQWGPLALLIGAAYLPGNQELEIGPLHFTAVRILVAVGLLRVMTKGERVMGGMNSLDKWMILWAVWLICSSVFHDSGVVITRLGAVFDDLGIYILFRVFLQELDDILSVFKIVCVVFIPLTAALLCEKATGKNYFGLLFGGWTEALVRNGHVRAQGPFEHPILAGTVGAVCLPMALSLWRQQRKLALVGLAATGGIIVASASSGPIMTLFSILGAMALWKIRGHLRAIRWSVVMLIVVLNFVMNDPVYFLVARIDLAGGSTGWYRAQLIRSAIEHFGEWWLAGTDYTRHWMDVMINSKQTDITNYYIQMGVWGGLPLMLLFIGVLTVAFKAVGRALRASQDAPPEYQFMIWTLGSILFGHATTFFSVSYFDQTVVFLFFVLAAIGSLKSAVLNAAPIETEGGPINVEPVAETQIQHG